jgi:hypothetical protein
MAVTCRLLKGCYAGQAGQTVVIDNEGDFEYLRKHGYAALVQYETASKVTPVRRTRGRPKKNG